jgi:uncharacterized protein
LWQPPLSAHITQFAVFPRMFTFPIRAATCPRTPASVDEIIRSYLGVGVDLQKEVHEDMVQNFAAYPNRRRWLLSHPDSNIDHCRVPNLMVFFTRKT